MPYTYNDTLAISSRTYEIKQREHFNRYYQTLQDGIHTEFFPYLEDFPQ